MPPKKSRAIEISSDSDETSSGGCGSVLEGHAKLDPGECSLPSTRAVVPTQVQGGTTETVLSISCGRQVPLGSDAASSSSAATSSSVQRRPARSSTRKQLKPAPKPKGRPRKVSKGPLVTSTVDPLEPAVVPVGAPVSHDWAHGSTIPQDHGSDPPHAAGGSRNECMASPPPQSGLHLGSVCRGKSTLPEHGSRSPRRKLRRAAETATAQRPQLRRSPSPRRNTHAPAASVGIESDGPVADAHTSVLETCETADSAVGGIPTGTAPPSGRQSCGDSAQPIQGVSPAADTPSSPSKSPSSASPLMSSRPPSATGPPPCPPKGVCRPGLGGKFKPPRMMSGPHMAPRTMVSAVPIRRPVLSRRGLARPTGPPAAAKSSSGVSYPQPTYSAPGGPGKSVAYPKPQGHVLKGAQMSAPKQIAYPAGTRAATAGQSVRPEHGYDPYDCEMSSPLPPKEEDEEEPALPLVVDTGHTDAADASPAVTGDGPLEDSAFVASQSDSGSEEDEMDKPHRGLRRLKPEWGIQCFKAVVHGTKPASKEERLLEKAQEAERSHRPRRAAAQAALDNPLHDDIGLDEDNLSGKRRGGKKSWEDMQKCLLVFHEQVGMCKLYNKFGQQYGNNSDGHPVRDGKVGNGDVLKVGTKWIKVGVPVLVSEFYEGSFFLRKEKKKARKATGLEKKQRKKAAGITLGKGFEGAKPKFRKRFVSGSTGFVVPVAGATRDKDGNRKPAEPTALHDPDRDGAVVLFRAHYKRDVHNRPLVSVVVDPCVGDKLRPHQKEGIQFLYDCVSGARVKDYNGCILADDMGLGKSIQAVTLLWTCLKQGKHGVPLAKKAVVVAPSSLVGNWRNEIFKWIGEDRFGKDKLHVIYDSSTNGTKVITRYGDPNSRGDLLITSYEQVKKYQKSLQSIGDIGLVICDEGHRLKNAEIKTSQAVDCLPTRWRVILSGTPIQNHLSEFHAMVNFVNCGIFGQLDVFKNVFEQPLLDGREPGAPDDVRALGLARSQYLSRMANQFILRRTATVNEKYLPAKVEMTVFCRLTDLQRKLYTAVTSGCQPEEDVLNYSGKPGKSTLAVITALKKLCNHPDLLFLMCQKDADRQAAGESGGTDESRTINIASIRQAFPSGYKAYGPDAGESSKFAVLYGLLNAIRQENRRPENKASPNKIVVISNYTQTLAVIAAMLQGMGIEFFQLDGSTPVKKRHEMVCEFNTPECPQIAFLLSSKAGGVGLNIVGANRLVLFDPDWNPANDAQAMARVWRDGQKKKVYIYRLLCTGTIDEKVYQRQVSKQGLSTAVIDSNAEDADENFTSDELRALFVYKGDTICETHDLLRCKCHLPDEKRETHDVKGTFKSVRKPTGPRVDELKSWVHCADLHGPKCPDPSLPLVDPTMSTITFVISNERDPQRQEPEVTRQAFTDESGHSQGTETNAAVEVSDNSESEHSSDSE